MDKDKLKNIAIKALEQSNVPKNDQHTFDPLTILMIISVILTCIRILQECNKNRLQGEYTTQDKYSLYGSQIKEYSSLKGWFTKMRIKKILRREMTPEDYKKYSLSLVSAILNTGEILTDDEIITLVEASYV